MYVLCSQWVEIISKCPRFLLYIYSGKFKRYKVNKKMNRFVFGRNMYRVSRRTMVGLSTDPAPLIMSKFFRIRVLHRGRNQRYSFQIDLDYGSSTLQFLQFWNQNVVNILFLVVKSLKVTSGLNSKLIKNL